MNKFWKILFVVFVKLGGKLLNCDHVVTLRANGTTSLGIHVRCLDAHEASVVRLKSRDLL